MLQRGYRAKIVRIDFSVTNPIPSFGVDIGPLGESSRFGSKLTRSELNDEVKGEELLRPPSLLQGEELRIREVCEILVIGNNINHDLMLRTFKIMTPDLESFDNGEN